MFLTPPTYIRLLRKCIAGNPGSCWILKKLATVVRGTLCHTLCEHMGLDVPPTQEVGFSQDRSSAILNDSVSVRALTVAVKGVRSAFRREKKKSIL